MVINMKKLSAKELNELKPTIWVGKNGLTATLMKEIALQVKTKGYIKGKILKSIRSEFEPMLSQILLETNSELVYKRGLTFILISKEEN